MMSKLKFSIFTLTLLCITQFAFSQKKINEGIAFYNITFEIEKQTYNSERNIFFNEHISRMEAHTELGSLYVFNDLINDTGMILSDFENVDENVAAIMTKEFISMRRASEPKYSNFIRTNEKQIINGFNCEKYSFKNEQGESQTIWVTTDIEIPANDITRLYPVKGTVVKFTSKYGEATLAKVLEEKTDLKKELKIPEGYKEIKPEEFFGG
ncbi:hypothetical protein [Pedobacter flavus]|uniref:GLPGLI family protein n=1 Tax=Pedobacter flavus TaxID=3113906 RepID=A0ABU7H3H4_9SPHI|nr:hypothetical protein [Pedobacter sp. VNH31]MEE1885851.1 hypothetical protein [Pedobacter sp. VNH31]